MEENPIEKAVDDLVDGVALVTSGVKRRIWIETTKSYSKAMLAAATALPVSIALSGTPTISQAQARKPEAEPHVPSQSQVVNLQEIQFYTTSTSGGDTRVPLGGQKITAFQGIMDAWHDQKI